MPELDQVLSQQERLLGIRANFVTNSHGEFVGINGSSRDLSNEADLALLKKLRSLADLVITDAATARNEGYRPSALAPIQIWSKTGNFEGLVAADAFALQQVTDPVAELEMLRKTKQAVLLETGPTLTAQLGDARIVDELKLTVTSAKSESDARHGAELAINQLHLGYLQRSSILSADGNHFFTFGR